MIAFVGSVFSPYYHFSGRKDPENHVAFNVALYRPEGAMWAMTERGRGSLSRSENELRVGNSRMRYTPEGLVIDFDETALPWPGQRLWPERISGRITLVAAVHNMDAFDLDPAGGHRWWPKMPRGRVSVACSAFAGGGFEGEGYHDINFGDRPLEKDFTSWDWARGTAKDGRTVIVYDALMKDGGSRRMGLSFWADGARTSFPLPSRQPFPRGFWGVRGGIACDAGAMPTVGKKLEDSPFYTRSLVETELQGQKVAMVHESLDCRRLANPLVRLMLPFKMPRRTRV